MRADCRLHSRLHNKFSMVLIICHALQMVLKVTAPLGWGLDNSAASRDSSAIEQEAWYPGRDSFAQVGANSSGPSD